MQATIASVLSKALRTAGQSLDAFGRSFEVVPYIEKREFPRQSTSLSLRQPATQRLSHHFLFVF